MTYTKVDSDNTNCGLTTCEGSTVTEDMIKMELREVSCEDADWVRLVESMTTWRILAYTGMNLRVL
jgi:hypothetical protein